MLPSLTALLTASGPTADRRSWWPRTPANQAIPLWAHGLLWGLLLLSNSLYWSFTHPKPWTIVAADVVLTGGTYAALFYLNWQVVIPRYLARKSVVKFVALLLLLLSAAFVVRIFSIISLGLTQLPNGYPAKVKTYSSTPQAYRGGYYLGHTISSSGGRVAVTSLLVLLLSFYLRLTADHRYEQRRRQEDNRRREELEKQHLAAELSLLKAQINPHFLFNTLNNIYSLTSEESPEAPAAVAVLQLAELMRYLLYESAADTVPLTKEISHLQSFLSLQRLRLPDASADRLHFEVAADIPAQYPIAPMLLLPLVENAFKHGDLAARPYGVHMSLTLSDGRLEFGVRNAMRRTVLPKAKGPGGVGLTNLRRRLQLLYPRRHELRIDESANHYHVTLTLLAPTAA